MEQDPVAIENVRLRDAAIEKIKAVGQKIAKLYGDVIETRIDVKEKRKMSAMLGLIRSKLHHELHGVEYFIPAIAMRMGAGYSSDPGAMREFRYLTIGVCNDGVVAMARATIDERVDEFNAEFPAKEFVGKDIPCFIARQPKLAGLVEWPSVPNVPHRWRMEGESAWNEYAPNLETVVKAMDASERMLAMRMRKIQRLARLSPEPEKFPGSARTAGFEAQNARLRKAIEP